MQFTWWLEKKRRQKGSRMICSALRMFTYRFIKTEKSNRAEYISLERLPGEFSVQVKQRIFSVLISSINFKVTS
jgi:hypothetical protein